MNTAHAQKHQMGVTTALVFLDSQEGTVGKVSALIAHLSIVGSIAWLYCIRFVS